MTTESKTTKRVYNLVIIDESGSMDIIRRQALAGINETITTCQKMQKAHKDLEQRITLITFDSDHFKLHYDNINAAEACPLTLKDYKPCAATPLYDAIGKGIAKINAQTEADDNVLVTIITDGEENCSEEYNLKMVKILYAKLKKQACPDALGGPEALDVEGMAGSMAIDNHLSFTEDAESTEIMFAKERRSRERYNECLYCKREMPIGSYFDEDKDKDKV